MAWWQEGQRSDRASLLLQVAVDHYRLSVHHIDHEDRLQYSHLYIYFVLIFRPPDIVCRRSYILPGFFLSFFLFLFSSVTLSELAEGNWTIFGHMVGSKCNLKMYVRNLGYPFCYKSGAQNHLFGPTSQLTGNFNGLYLWNTLTAYILGRKHDIDNQSSALTTTRGLLHRPRTSWTLVHKRLQTRPALLPTLCKFCILLHCKASQMEISKRNSTKLCQVMGSKSP